MTYKNWILLVASTIFWATGKSQPDIINNTSVKSDSSVIYKEVQNFLKVIGVTDYHFVKLKSSKLLITATKDAGVFLAKAQSFGTDTVYLTFNGKSGFSKKNKIVSVPPVTAILGNSADSLMTLKQVIGNPNLLAVRMNCNCRVGHIIGNFRITFISKHLGNLQNSYYVSGGRFDFLIDIIKQLQPNDKIAFDNIVTVDIDSLPLKLKDFTITIR